MREIKFENAGIDKDDLQLFPTFELVEELTTRFRPAILMGSAMEFSNILDSSDNEFYSTTFLDGANYVKGLKILQTVINNRNLENYLGKK